MALSLDNTSFARIYREEGIKEGGRAKELEVAKKMLLEGLSKELVVKVTTLGMEEVEKLQAELNN